MASWGCLFASDKDAVAQEASAYQSQHAGHPSGGVRNVLALWLHPH